MFSYRHAFHAGNHADVLKHAILVHVLDHFNRKDNPYWVIDTHAGAGIYDLEGKWSSARPSQNPTTDSLEAPKERRPEYLDGVMRLHTADHPPELITRYLEALEAFNAPDELRYYPGSPWLTMEAMRDRDRLRLFELHPSEVDVLAQNLSHHARGRSRQVVLEQADGFAGIKALLPPPTRRGMVLIDPSYENKNDYKYTLSAVQEGLKRFATGTFIVWYPLVQRREVQNLTRALERLDTVWVHAALQVKRPASDGFGLHGSGMFVVNPPWTLHDSLAQALPWLAKTLGQDQRAGFTLTRSARS
ncbi:23S rRNA (adenine(2030)-N(6))-methyltransferase RlmJ [Achromobacter sp. F4_2707]|uniref:23S rRNA (adenine(2030)-N(6))-methyltransferase RlmJ n=1 Tax=Achromobacter sp. F4_2707 TaxID=3114286 RepID=UPI0039C6A702